MSTDPTTAPNPTSPAVAVEVDGITRTYTSGPTTRSAWLTSRGSSSRWTSLPLSLRCGGRALLRGRLRARAQLRLTLGPGFSGMPMVIGSAPDKEPKIIAGRVAQHHANMTRVVEGIKATAEPGA